MNWSLVFFGVLCSVALATSVKENSGQMNVRIDQLYQCKLHPNTTMLLHNIIISNGGLDKFEVKGETIVSKDVTDELVMVAEIEKCYDKERVSCMRLMSPKDENVCHSITTKEGAMLKQFVTLWGLSPHCPFRQGNYVITPDNFDVSSMHNLAKTLGRFWNADLSLRSKKTGQYHFCVHAEVELTRVEKQRAFTFNKG